MQPVQARRPADLDPAAVKGLGLEVPVVIIGFAAEHLVEQVLAVFGNPPDCIRFEVPVQERVPQVLLEIPGQALLRGLISGVRDRNLILGLVVETHPDAERPVLILAQLANPDHSHLSALRSLTVTIRSPLAPVISAISRSGCSGCSGRSLVISL